MLCQSCVAPHAGARIETLYTELEDSVKPSLPMRERELKLRQPLRTSAQIASLPMRERELKLTGLH